MKTTITTLTLAAILALPLAASADEYDDTESHPMRLAAYLIHPIGLAFEWALFRPLHLLASANPTTEYIFGHEEHNQNAEKGFDPAFRQY